MTDHEILLKFCLEKNIPFDFQHEVENSVSFAFYLLKTRINEFLSEIKDFLKWK